MTWPLGLRSLVSGGGSVSTACIMAGSAGQFRTKRYLPPAQPPGAEEGDLGGEGRSFVTSVPYLHPPRLTAALARWCPEGTHTQISSKMEPNQLPPRLRSQALPAARMRPALDGEAAYRPPRALKGTEPEAQGSEDRNPKLL